MNKIYYDKVEESDDPTEVAFHNMKFADNILDLQIFIGGEMGWLDANPSKNFYDLEVELRKRNFNTHLIAKPPHIISPDSKLGFPKRNEDIEYIYECITSCRPTKYALEEVLSAWPTYEDNLNALKSSANIIISQTTVLPKEDLKIDEDDPVNMIAKNKVKVRIETLSADEAIEKIIENTKKSLGKAPSMTIYGMSHLGGPIMAFVVDNKIVSNIGVCIEHDSEGNKIKRLCNLF